MNLCSDGHGEVCFDGKYCPACELREVLITDVNNLKEEIREMRDLHQDQLIEKEDEIRELCDRLAEAER